MLKRATLALLAAALLDTVCRAQTVDIADERTNERLNGRFWSRLPEEFNHHYKLYFVLGYCESGECPVQPNYGEIVKGIDKFYDEPENLRLPIFLAMRVFAMKVAGAKATEIEAVMNAAREYADKPDAKVQLKEPQAQAHRVLIAYPEHWNDGERRPCFLGPAGGGTVSQAMGQPADIPQLDCDRFVQGELIHRTPAERIFTLEVDFTGDFAGALESRRRYVYKETAWTCQRRGDAITCTP